MTDILFDEWKISKASIKKAQAELLEIESDIYEKYKHLIKPYGTTNIGDLKIVTGHTEKWDQDKLTEAYVHYKNSGLNSPFGFKTEFKAVKKELDQCDKGFYETYIQPALTISPKKPSFTVKGEE